MCVKGEQDFWIKLLDRYLAPIKESAEHKLMVTKELKSLRNKVHKLVFLKDLRERQKSPLFWGFLVVPTAVQLFGWKCYISNIILWGLLVSVISWIQANYLHPGSLM